MGEWKPVPTEKLLRVESLTEAAMRIVNLDGTVGLERSEAHQRSRNADAPDGCVVADLK
jgi:hypothetical protein